MTTKRIKSVSISKLRIHSQAVRAFTFAQHMRFELNAMWSKVLMYPSLTMPWAIYNADDKCYDVFANWQPLLGAMSDDTSIDCVVWESVPGHAATMSWQTVASILGHSAHRKDVLFHIAQFIHEAPASLQQQLFDISGSHSEETTARLFCDEKRSPVRKAVEMVRLTQRG